MTKQCWVAGCDRPHYARGLCHGHYQRVVRQRSRGDPGEAELNRVWRKWTPAEDRALLELGDGRPHCGKDEVTSLALHLNRTAGACRTRRCKLRRARREEQTDLALAEWGAAVFPGG